jgi:hypothetical protein
MFRVGSSGDGEFPRATSGFLGPNLKNSLQGLDMQVKRSEPCGVVKYYSIEGALQCPPLY